MIAINTKSILNQIWFILKMCLWHKRSTFIGPYFVKDKVYGSFLLMISFYFVLAISEWENLCNVFHCFYNAIYYLIRSVNIYFYFILPVLICKTLSSHIKHQLIGFIVVLKRKHTYTTIHCHKCTKLVPHLFILLIVWLTLNWNGQNEIFHWGFSIHCY